MVVRWRKALLATERFDALAGISFLVRPGEVYAVIGPNGAGKTTLLRVLAGIVPPADGRVCVRGRIAPLIDLGAGFDPELTGDENLLLYASLLGMPVRQIRARRTAIVDFAELGGVMDVPVKNYSSGMVARLGFAIATTCSPDLLLVDEVLAVGDQSFRGRCLERIAELRASGTAIVLVSHDLELVRRTADRGLLLEAGRSVAAGSSDQIVDSYVGVARS